MPEEDHELVVWHLLKLDDLLLLLLEVVREESLEVVRPRRKDHLMAVDVVAINNQSDVAEVLLVQQPKEVSLVSCLLNLGCYKLRLEHDLRCRNHLHVCSTQVLLPLMS
jgi:hypothetical protein